MILYIKMQKIDNIKRIGIIFQFVEERESLCPQIMKEA